MNMKYVLAVIGLILLFAIAFNLKGIMDVEQHNGLVQCVAAGDYEKNDICLSFYPNVGLR